MATISHGTWGERVVTRETEESLTTILYLKPHRRCSFHYHKAAYNQFYVISGKLGVLTNIGPGDNTELTVLYPRQTFVVPPGVPHEFQTYEHKTVIEEIAYVAYDKADIHRLKLGGDLNE